MGKLMLSLVVGLGLVCGVSAAELPYDCELEYLTVAKGVHFDTGVQVTSAPTARVKFAFQDGTTMDVFGTTEAVDGCFILNALNVSHRPSTINGMLSNWPWSKPHDARSDTSHGS